MYGKVAASEMPAAAEDDIWLGRPEERELRRLWTRRLAVGLVGLIALSFISHHPLFAAAAG